MTIRCIPLGDAPQAATTLAAWFMREWPDYYAGRTLAQVTSDFPATSPGGYPFIVVALEDHEVRGTAALRESSIRPLESLTPWLGGLYVDAAARRRGIARALIHAVEAEARARGVEVLRSGTVSAHAVFEALGWRCIGDGVQGKEPVTVYERTL